MSVCDQRRRLYKHDNGWSPNPLADGFVPVQAVGRVRPAYAFAVNVSFDRFAEGATCLADTVYVHGDDGGDREISLSARGTAAVLAAVLTPLDKLCLPYLFKQNNILRTRRGVVIELVSPADDEQPSALRVWILVFDPELRPGVAVSQLICRNNPAVKGKRKRPQSKPDRAPLDPASGATLLDTAHFARAVAAHLKQPSSPPGPTAGADGADVVATEAPVLPRALCAVGDFETHVRAIKGCTFVPMNVSPASCVHAIEPSLIFGLGRRALRACVPNAAPACCDPQSYVSENGLRFTPGTAWALVGESGSPMTARLPGPVLSTLHRYQKACESPLGRSFANRIKYVALGAPV